MNQNNVRVSAGLVYTFRPKAPASGATGEGMKVPTGTRIPVLGITVEDSEQLRIVSVESDGPAARSGIKEGDSILSVNDKAVRTGQELNAALAANTSRKVKVGYLIRGAWTVQVNVDLGMQR